MPAESSPEASPAKKVISVLLLPGIAALLMAYYAIFEMDSGGASEAPRASRRLFSGLSTSSAEKVEIRAGEKTLLISSDSGRFRMLRPTVGDVNQDEVIRLLSILSSAEYERVLPLEEAGDLSQFGLREPRFVVEVRLQSASRGESGGITVHFGRRSPSRAHVYGIVPGGKEVLIIDARLVDQITYFLHVPPVDRSPRDR